MKLISHRGNTAGPQPKFENRPEYIISAIRKGYDVEVDVWLQGNHFMLGHDEPQYEVDKSFLISSPIWCHAKNVEALSRLIEIEAHCFWHQNDDVTLTSRGLLWIYPGKKLVPGSVCVIPEVADYSNEELSACYAVCSDYVERYK